MSLHCKKLFLNALKPKTQKKRKKKRRLRGFLSMWLAITQFDKKKVIFCPHVLMVIFPFLGGKNDGK